MLRILVSVCLSTSLLGCGGLTDGGPGTETSPITGGVVDSSRPAVGALVNPSTLQIFCSGTLISTSPPRMLSAAHCLKGKTPSQLKVAFGPTETSWQTVVDVARVIVHPNYDSSFNATKPSDIAFVDLVSVPQIDGSAIQPIAANAESLAGRTGEDWLFMGYGADHMGRKHTWAGYGIKRSVYIPISLVSDTRGEFDYYATYATAAPGSTQAANTCYGDSGGPALTTNSSSQEVVVGVTSRGSADCGADGALGIDTRVDSFYSFVSQPAPVCGDGSCSGGETCGSCAADCGACPVTSQCASCATDADCGAGARCFQLTTESAKACHLECGSSADCPDGLSCGRVARGYGNRCLACP